MPGPAMERRLQFHGVDGNRSETKPRQASTKPGIRRRKETALPLFDARPQASTQRAHVARRDRRYHEGCWNDSTRKSTRRRVFIGKCLRLA